MARTYIAWLDDVAHYWIWTSPEDAGEAHRRWVPETCLLTPATEDGVRLLQLSQGVEGQVWEGGQLLASQWWAQTPEPQAWQLFVRSAGIDPVDAPSPSRPQELAWMEAPWGESRRGLAIDARAGERIAWSAALLVFAVALGWQVTGLIRWRAAAVSEHERLEATRAKAAPLVDARERAELALADIDQLLDLQRGVSDYALMADVAETLPEGTQLSAWSRDPSRLRILASGAETDPRKFIAAFSNVPRLADLTATPTGGGSMLLEISLPEDDSLEGGK